MITKFFKIDKIPLKKVLENNSLNYVHMYINKSEKEMFPEIIRSITIVLSAFLISLVTLSNGYIFILLSTCILIYVFLLYLKSPKYLKKLNYELLKYVCVQNSFIFYITTLIAQVSTNDLLNTLLAILFVIVSYAISLYIAYIRILDDIKSKYSIGKQTDHSFINWSKIRKILICTVGFIIVAMQFYRFNKWWINDTNSDFLAVLNDTLLGDVFSIVIVTIALCILTFITLLPLLMLNSKIIADGLVFKYFSEKLRTTNEFTKKEWYGDI